MDPYFYDPNPLKIYPNSLTLCQFVIILKDCLIDHQPVKCPDPINLDLLTDNFVLILVVLAPFE